MDTIVPPARPAPIALSRPQRAAVYEAVSGLTLTGLAWLAVAGPFPFVDRDAVTSAARTAAAWSLRLHGVAAYAALVVVGSVLPVHLWPAWRRARNRWSGSGLSALLVLLAATGLWLAYGSEASHGAVSLLHWTAGLALPAWIVVHRALGLATRRSHGARPG